MNIIQFLTVVKSIMKKKLIVVLQARSSSKRLPKKVLKKINGIPIVLLCVKRLTNKGARLVVATSKSESDNELVKLLKKNKIEFFKDKLTDVLSRYQNIAKSLSPQDYIVRATADNVFPDGELVEKVFKVFKAGKDYFGINHKDHFTERYKFRNFSSKENTRIEKRLSRSDKEHVTQYIYRSKPKIFYKKIISSIKIKKDLSKKV